MLFEDFHVHTSFSDGADSPDEMAETAYRLGVRRLGFSDHGYAPYDTDCCVPEERQLAYCAAVARLKRRWAGKMEIFCGVERDLYGPVPAGDYDYVIGSVHYLQLDGGYYTVDWKPEILREMAERFFGGDLLAVAEAYFQAVAEVPARTDCDLIGHFDLVSKLNERHRLFDFAHPRYVAAWRMAADALLETGLPFEINTGGMSRLWRTEPYPAWDILRYLAARGAKFVLNSDAHSRRTLLYHFPQVEKRARTLGAEFVPFPCRSRGRTN